MVPAQYCGLLLPLSRCLQAVIERQKQTEGQEDSEKPDAAQGQGESRKCPSNVCRARPGAPSQLHGGVEGARGWGRGAQGLTLPFFLLADKTPTPQALLVQLLVSSGAAGKELFWPGAGGGAGAGLLLLFGVELPGGRSRVPGGRSEPVSLCPHLGGGGFCWVRRMRGRCPTAAAGPAEQDPQIPEGPVAHAHPLHAAVPGR